MLQNCPIVMTLYVCPSVRQSVHTLLWCDNSKMSQPTIFILHTQIEDRETKTPIDIGRGETIYRFDGIPRYTSLGSVHGTGRIGKGTITVRIRFYLKEIFCFNWHRIRFVHKSAGSKQLCTIKKVVYLDVIHIQNTNLGQLCSVYCKANIVKVFKDHNTGYVVWSEEIRDFFQCKFIVQRSQYTLDGQFIW